MPIIKVGKRKIRIDDPKVDEIPIVEPIVKKKGVADKKENESKERD